MTSYQGLNVNKPPPTRHEGSQHTPGPEALRGDDMPGAVELIAARFEPLDSLTGATWIGEEWPHEYKRAIPRLALTDGNGTRAIRSGS